MDQARFRRRQGLRDKINTTDSIGKTLFLYNVYYAWKLEHSSDYPNVFCMICYLIYDSFRWTAGIEKAPDEIPGVESTGRADCKRARAQSKSEKEVAAILKQHGLQSPGSKSPSQSGGSPEKWKKLVMKVHSGYHGESVLNSRDTIAAEAEALAFY
eukprot:880508-Rhodomonas_salina.1